MIADHQPCPALTEFLIFPIWLFEMAKKSKFFHSSVIIQHKQSLLSDYCSSKIVRVKVAFLYKADIQRLITYRRIKTLKNAFNSQLCYSSSSDVRFYAPLTSRLGHHKQYLDSCLLLSKVDAKNDVIEAFGCSV